MKAEHYSVHTERVSGWPVRITTYRIGPLWYAKADNVSPGANIARARAKTREEVLEAVASKARARLAATVRR